MTPLHPLIERAFDLARTEPGASGPPLFLEERVIADWRALQAPRDALATHRMALAFACALAIVSLVITYGFITPEIDPAVAIANAALQESLLR